MAKGLLALLDPPNHDDESDSGDESDEELDAMKDFLSAVEEKDPKAMKLAFARAYEACAMKHEHEDKDEEY